MHNKDIMRELRQHIDAGQQFQIKDVAAFLPSLSGLSTREARRELKRVLTELGVERQGKRWKL